MRTRFLVPAAAALAVLLALPAAGQPPRGQQPAAREKATGNVVLKLTMEDGTSFGEGSLYLKERKLKLKKDQKALSLLDVPVEVIAPTAEVFVKQGWFKPKRRYLGVTPVQVVKDKSVEAEIILRPLETVDAFCSPCHPTVEEGFVLGAPIQLRRDLHVSGLELGPRYRQQVEAFNKRIKKAERDGVPHSYPILLEERKDKKTYYTCESCHTPHVETPYGSYVVADFKEESILCKGCHY